MTEREQLIKLLDTAFNAWETTDKIADFLLKNNVMIKPCNVGDKVYIIHHISDAIPDFIGTDQITKIGIVTRGVMFEQGYDFSELDKTIFLDPNEAKNRLQERKENR